MGHSQDEIDMVVNSINEMRLDILNYITDQKEAQKALQESEKKFRSLFEHAPLAIIHLDNNRVVTACNENLCKIIGSTQDEITGLNTLKTLKDGSMKLAIRKALSGVKSQYSGAISVCNRQP